MELKVVLILFAVAATFCQEEQNVYDISKVIQARMAQVDDERPSNGENKNQEANQSVERAQPDQERYSLFSNVFDILSKQFFLPNLSPLKKPESGMIVGENRTSKVDLAPFVFNTSLSTSWTTLTPEQFLQSIKNDFYFIRLSNAFTAPEKAFRFWEMIVALGNYFQFMEKLEADFLTFKALLQLEYEQAICSQTVPVVVGTRFCRFGKWEFQIGWTVNYNGNWLLPGIYNVERLRVFGDLYKLNAAGGTFLSTKLPVCLNCDYSVISEMTKGCQEVLNVFQSLNKSLQISVELGNDTRDLEMVDQLFSGPTKHGGFHSIKLVVDAELRVNNESMTTCNASEEALQLVKKIRLATSKLQSLNFLVTVSFAIERPMAAESRTNHGEPQPLVPPINPRRSYMSKRSIESQKEELISATHTIDAQPFSNLKKRAAELKKEELPPTPTIDAQPFSNLKKRAAELKKEELSATPTIDITAFSSTCLNLIGAETGQMFDFLTIRDGADEVVVKAVKDVLKMPVVLQSDNIYEQQASLFSGVTVDMPLSLEGYQLQRVENMQQLFLKRNILVEKLRSSVEFE